MEEELVRRFVWADYLIFGLTLLISLAVGVYHACKGVNTTADYLLGGRKMSQFPIAMSLAASSLSATTLLGTPSDVYLTGTMYWWIVVGAAIAIPSAAYLYLPIFFKLQVVSANEYLERRFNRHIRQLASFLYVFRQVFYLSIVVYGPSLALKQVTGIDVYTSVSILFVVCIFYTSIGGIKAVVWTDTIQIFIIYGSIIGILMKGTIDLGFHTLWQRNVDSGRIDFFNVDLNPTTRHTVWSLVIGGYFYWTAWFATDQTTVQRFLSISSLKQAKMSMLTNLVCVVGIFSFSCYAGLVIFARYYDCDPLASNMINKADQIFPFYVMDTVGQYPGIPGLFVAGIFSGALSTLSSGLNAIPLTILEDFVRPHFPAMPERSATTLSKVISLVFGLVCFALVFLVAQVDTILEATLSIIGSVAGSLLGVFTLGMFNPWANSMGAGVGTVTAFILMLILGMSTQIAKSSGLIHTALKPLTTANCSAALNITVINTTQDDSLLSPSDESSFLVLLRISYLWYTLIGLLIVLIVGSIVSYLTKPQDPRKLDPKLICNVGHHFSWFLPERLQQLLKCSVGETFQEKEAAAHEATEMLKWNQPQQE